MVYAHGINICTQMRDILLNFMPTWCVFEWSDLTQKYFDKYPCGFLICISFRTSRQMVKCIVKLKFFFCSSFFSFLVSMMNRFEIRWWQSVFLRFGDGNVFHKVKWKVETLFFCFGKKTLNFDKWWCVRKLDYYEFTCTLYIHRKTPKERKFINSFNPPPLLIQLKS